MKTIKPASVNPIVLAAAAGLILAGTFALAHFNAINPASALRCWLLLTFPVS